MKRLIPLIIALILTISIIPTYAAETVPSIEQKGTPKLVTASDTSIKLIPLFEAEQTPELKTAYKAAVEVDLGDNIVIRDIFAVEGNVKSGTITLDLSTYGDKNQIVILEFRDGEWQAIPNDRLKFNDDGTVEVILDDLCPLAIAQGVMAEGEGDGCPFILCRFFKTDIACNHTHCLQFNHRCFCWIWWLLLLILIILVIVTIIKIIKKIKEKIEEDKEDKQEN